MDIVLDYADRYALDGVYASVMPIPLGRDHIVRQTLSLFGIVLAYAHLFYFAMAGFSYYVLYDRNQMQHPKFLRGQIRQEIAVAVKSFLPVTLMTVPWFVGEVRGHSRLYSRVDEQSGGWLYLAGSVVFFLFFTDMMIYWIHRALHHRLLYAPLHKLHHRWIVPTPFASHAFHPLDGYLQSVPYHLFVYLFPMHKVLYLSLFLFVNLWTVSIHDGGYMSRNKWINGAANHTLHHLYFNYNYGQYFTLWDIVGGTYRMPTEAQFNTSLKHSANNRRNEAREMERIVASDPDMLDKAVTYLDDTSGMKDGTASGMHVKEE